MSKSPPTSGRARRQRRYFGYSAFIGFIVHGFFLEILDVIQPPQFINSLPPFVTSHASPQFITRLVALLVIVPVVFALLNLVLFAIPGLSRIPSATRNAAAAGANIFWRRLTGRPYATVFTPSQRGEDDFRELIMRELRNTNQIGLRLLTGHTMFHDEAESFIFEYLQSLAPAERAQKQCSVQLLDRDHPAWEQRTRWYVDHVLSHWKPSVGYEAYVARCRDVVADFQKLGFDVGLYSQEPLWRIHLFDRVVLVSWYKNGAEGHLTPCAVIPRGSRNRPNSLYEAFAAEFSSAKLTTLSSPGPSSSDASSRVISIAARTS